MALWNERQAREKQARSPKCDESGLVGVWQVMVSIEHFYSLEISRSLIRLKKIS